MSQIKEIFILKATISSALKMYHEENQLEYELNNLNQISKIKVINNYCNFVYDLNENIVFYYENFINKNNCRFLFPSYVNHLSLNDNRFMNIIVK